MTTQELETTYQLIQEKHQQFLAPYGVKLPKLINNNGQYTKDSLVLIKLAQGYPATQVISKIELTQFVQQYYPEVADVQQARHLAMQSGFNILSGTRGDVQSKIPSGS